MGIGCTPIWRQLPLWRWLDSEAHIVFKSGPLARFFCVLFALAGCEGAEREAGSGSVGKTALQCSLLYNVKKRRYYLLYIVK